MFKLIRAVKANGFPVVAMVNDLGPTNIRLWNSLGIDMERTHFDNPAANDRKVFVFADAPHLIKLIRNYFLDYGFDLQENCKVNSECVREIINSSMHDCKTIHKLSLKHVGVTGVKRMNVKLVVQLLSNTTSKTIDFFVRKGLLHSHDWESTSEFISLVDSWSDLFNSRLKADHQKH